MYFSRYYYCNVQPARCLLAAVQDEEHEEWKLYAPFGLPPNFSHPGPLVFVPKAELDINFLLFELPNNEWLGTVKIHLYDR
jgi:hypothetical protein